MLLSIIRLIRRNVKVWLYPAVEKKYITCLQVPSVGVRFSFGFPNVNGEA